MLITSNFHFKELSLSVSELLNTSSIYTLNLKWISTANTVWKLDSNVEKFGENDAVG